MTLFTEFEATTLDGQTQSMDAYAGQVVLVVNTASECGFTPQYQGLEKLWQEYRDRGLVVLGFPCNQFGGQEPGDADQIGAFCEKNYGVTFPMFAKVDVNGSEAHAIYEWLRSQKKGLLGGKIRWNFTKFLIGRDGTVIGRYAPTTEPAKIADDIVAALG